MRTLSLGKLSFILTNMIVALVIGTFLYILATENVFQTYTPRSVCMFRDYKLVTTHAISDGIIFVAYMMISVSLYNIYLAFRKKEIPFKGFFWMYAGFIFLCGITHFFGVLNLWITYYWWDGIFKLLTAWFSIAVAISFLRASKSIKEFKTPAEYNKLAQEIKELREQLSRKENK